MKRVGSNIDEPPRKRAKIGPFAAPEDLLRKQEFELILSFYDEFECSLQPDAQSLNIVELCQLLDTQYKKEFCSGPTTYQNEKALMLGKEGHQSSLSSITRWLSWFQNDFSPAISRLQQEKQDEHKVVGFPNLPPELFFLSHSLFRKQFVAWKCLSVVDFLVFPSIHWFLQTVIGKNNAWEMAKDYFLHLLEWFERMQRRPEIAKAGSFPFIDVASVLPNKFETKQELDAFYNTNKPVMMVTDVTCAHKDRKKSKHQLQNVFPKFDDAGLCPDYRSDVLGPIMDWNRLDSNLDPEAGKLGTKRAEDKRAQIENIQQVAEKFLCDGDVIVDFCCGGGHLAIVLAYLFPKCKVILVDRKDVSLAYAVQRLRALKITNVEIFHGDLFEFKDQFDLALAIHSCGFLTDLVMDIAIQKNAAYVVAPCCFGGMTNNQKIKYPRSTKFESCQISLEDYLHLTSGADLNTHKKDTFGTTEYDIGKKCMGLIDMDRNGYAVDHGYEVRQYTMVPPTCTPKNDVIAGCPKTKPKGTLTRREFPQSK